VDNPVDKPVTLAADDTAAALAIFADAEAARLVVQQMLRDAQATAQAANETVKAALAAAQAARAQSFRG